MNRLLLVFLLLVLFSGCSGDPVKKLLDAKFPPVSKEEQQKRAIDSLTESITQMELPALSVGVSLVKLESVIQKELRKDPSIKSIRLIGDNQLLTIKVEVDKTFKKSDWEDKPDIKNILGESDITYKGDINLSVTLAAKIEGDEGNRIFKINLLPTLNSVSVKDIKSGDIKAELLAETLFFLINRYVENVNGQLKMLPALETKVPLEMIDAENPSKVIKSKKDSDVQYIVTITSEDIHIPVKIGGHAIMLDKDHIKAMVSFVPLERDEPFNPRERPADFSQVKSLYDNLHQEAFGAIDINQTAWVALTKNLVALSINSVINQAQACFDVLAVAPVEKIPTSKVPPPDWKDIDCTPTKDCTPTMDCTPKKDCTFDKDHDERPCYKCLVNKPFGGCWIRGNDPACEAAKATQNAIYEAAYAKKKFECETTKTAEKTKCEAEKSTKKLACEASKTAEKDACEIGKEFIKRVTLAGPVANIDGEVGGEVAGKVCLETMAVKSDLSTMQLGVRVGGNVNMDGNIKLTPLNLGHLVCIAPTDFPLDFTLRLPTEVLSLESELTFEEHEGQFGLSFKTKDLTFPVYLTPSPTEWIVTNIDMAIKCPIANLFTPLIVFAAPFVPELQGISEYKQKAVEGFIELKIPSEKVGNQDIELVVGANEKALIVTTK
jgi:hypothetical protein